MYSTHSAWLAKRHVHDGRRVPLGGGQVDQAALAQERDAAAVGQDELLDEGTRLARRDGHLSQRRDVDLDVKVARVGQDGAVLHHLEMAGGR